MKYVIANCTEEGTSVFMYETEYPKELFKFVKTFNKNSENEIFESEIEVWEYPSDIPFETMMKIASNNLHGTISFYDLWQNELLGKQILSGHIDNTNKINVLLEDE